MPEVTIRIRGFTYYKQVENPTDPDHKLTVAQFATRGQTLEVSDADFERGQEIDAFVTDGEDGDAPTDFAVVDASDDELDEYLEENNPNVSETIALAGNDPESAQRLLESERRVTEGEPRQGVVDGLEKIIG